MSVAQSASGSAAPRSNRTFLALARVFNRISIRVAGSRVFPLYGVIEHRGRRSGKVFRTPVVVKPTSDGFIVPMPYGESTDWFRNVLAAGGCVIRWNGREYRVGDPEVIHEAATKPIGFGSFERALMRQFGINLAVHLRRQD